MNAKRPTAEELVKTLSKHTLPIVSIRRAVQTVGPSLGKPCVEIRSGSEHGTARPMRLNQILNEAKKISPKIVEHTVSIVAYDLLHHLEQIKWLTAGAAVLTDELILETDGSGLWGKVSTICGCTQLIVTPRQFDDVGKPLNLEEILGLSKYEHVHFRFLISNMRSLDYFRKQMKDLVLQRGRNPIVFTPTGDVTPTLLREVFEENPLPNVLIVPEIRF